MKDTKYLTGYHNGRYRKELEPLRNKRINDMRNLQKTIREDSRYLSFESKEYTDLEIQYMDIEKAIDHWKKL